MLQDMNHREAVMRQGKGFVSSLFSAACLIAAAVVASPAQSQAPRVTVYEGARLITGDGSPAIENSAFVVQGTQITQVGRKGQVQVPAGAGHVDLTGKTVMPTLTDMHGHYGFQNLAQGTMSKESFTRASPIDQIHGLASFG